MKKDKILLSVSVLLFMLLAIIGGWFYLNKEEVFSTNNKETKSVASTDHKKEWKEIYESSTKTYNDLKQNVNSFDQNQEKVEMKDEKVHDDFYYLLKNATFSQEFKLFDDMYRDITKLYNNNISKSEKTLKRDYKKLTEKNSELLIKRDELLNDLDTLKPRLEEALRKADSLNKPVDLEKLVENYCSEIKDCKYFKKGEDVKDSLDDVAMQLIDATTEYKENDLISNVKEFAMKGYKGYPYVMVFKNPKEANKAVEKLTNIGDYEKSDNYNYSIADKTFILVKNVIINTDKNSKYISGLSSKEVTDAKEFKVKNRGKLK